MILIKSLKLEPSLELEPLVLINLFIPSLIVNRVKDFRGWEDLYLIVGKRIE